MKNHQLFIYFICLVSAMGGLLFGYDWVVIGGAKPFYEEYFHIAGDEGMQALAMSIALLGCLLGATMAGFLADRYGRKKLLVLSAFIFFASSWATGAATAIPAFIIARLVGGMAIGLAADLSPMYIAEVAPTQIRGKLVTLNQLTIVLGILGAQIVNMLIAEPVPEGATAADILNSWNGQTGWRWMFWAVCVPSGLFFLLALFIPESPRWLASMKQMEKARKVLCSIGGAAYADSEIENYTRAGAASHAEKGVLSLLFSSKMRNVLINCGSHVPAVERYQCHLQLCAGNLSGSRLWHFRRTDEHCRDRYCQSGLYVCGHLYRRPPGKKDVDADRFHRTGRYLYPVGIKLFL